jgi:hypothetical protein
MLDCRRTRRRRTGEEHRGPVSFYAVDCCNSLLRRSSVDKDKQRMQSQGRRRRTSGGKCFVCGEEEEEEEEEESKRYCKTLVEIDVNNSKGRYSPHPGGVGREFGG